MFPGSRTADGLNSSITDHHTEFISKTQNNYSWFRGYSPGVLRVSVNKLPLGETVGKRLPAGLNQWAERSVAGWVLLEDLFESLQLLRLGRQRGPALTERRREVVARSRDGESRGHLIMSEGQGCDFTVEIIDVGLVVFDGLDNGFDDKTCQFN